MEMIIITEKDDILDNIEKMLNNKSLDGDKIYKGVREEIGIINIKIFYDALYELLDSEKINVVGYNKKSDDKSRTTKEGKIPKQKQSFKFQGIIFSDSKFTFSKLRKSIENIVNNDLEENSSDWKADWETVLEIYSKALKNIYEYEMKIYNLRFHNLTRIKTQDILNMIECVENFDKKYFNNKKYISRESILRS